jgi:hypothetical protein
LKQCGHHQQLAIQGGDPFERRSGQQTGQSIKPEQVMRKCMTFGDMPNQKPINDYQG